MGKPFLEALPNPLIQLVENSIVYFTAAETFLKEAWVLKGLPFTELLPENTPLLEMVSNVRHSGNSITDHDLVLESIQVASGLLTLTFHHT